MTLALHDDLYDAQFVRALAYTAQGGAEIGECFATATRITKTDGELWYREWLATAQRAHRAADESAASPAVSAIAKAERMPMTNAKANSRTIGIGESTSERKPTVVASAAVAITGPPRTAAITAAAAGRSPASAASRKRACSWIA